MQTHASALSLRSYSSEAQLHCHADHHQLVLPHAGVLDIEVAGHGGRVTAVQAVFVHAGEKHAFHALSAERSKFLVLDIVAGTDRVGASKARLFGELGRRPFFGVTPAVKYLLGYAGSVLRAESESCRNAFTAGRLEAWCELLFDAVETELLRRPCRDRAEVALVRALDFMTHNYAASISAEAIARAAGLSESHLYRLFRERLGSTPREYLANIRLSHALELLADPRLSIAEVAVRTGHPDQSAFTRRMQAAHGTTPAAYRRSRVAVGGSASAQRKRDSVKNLPASIKTEEPFCLTQRPENLDRGSRDDGR